MIRTLLLSPLLIIACLPAVSANGDEGARAAEAVASRAAEAFDAKDEDRLARLARKRTPDPWMVADALCARKRFDAALAFSQAAPRPGIARLPTYVDLRRKQPTPAPWRIALGEAEKLLAERRFAEAYERLDGLVDTHAISAGEAEEQKTITAVRVLAISGRALAGQELSAAGIRLVEAAHIASGIGWRQQALRLTGEATGIVASQQEAHAESMMWQSALATVAQMNIYMGEYEAAAPMLRARLDATFAAKNWIHAHDAGLGLGRCLLAMGHLAAAETAVEKALEAARAFGFDLSVATALADLGGVAERRGEPRRALELRLEAAGVFRRVGARTHEASMRQHAAMLCRDLAEYPRALALFDQCLEIHKDVESAARKGFVLSQIGATYSLLGNARKAREYMQQALDLIGSLGDPSHVAAILLSLANLQIAGGDPAAALRAQERALQLYSLDENPAGIASACANIGLLHANEGEEEKALAWRRRARETAEKHGRTELRARILLGTGEIRGRLGQTKEGLALVVEAAREAERLEMPDLALNCHRARALLLYRLRRYEEALGAANTARAWIPRVMGGLAEEESAGVRERSASLFDVGVLAAWKLKRWDAVLRHQESGRAGGLLESLGGRERLRGAAIPPALAREEAEARARESRAGQRLRAAVEAGFLKQVRTARKALGEARTRVERVVERIQRETKAAAQLVYPQPASAEAIRGALGTRGAVVLYSVLPENVLATVVTPSVLRVVDLGAPKPVTDACAALDPRGDEATFERSLQALRARIAAPLMLGTGVDIVHVSPSGPLCYVPLALLFPGREVVCVPSGTVHTVLQEEVGRRGEGVLALGDPVYEGDALTRLPQTRIEAEALGTTVLVGKDATEARLFEAAGKRTRWRAVHLACHGLVDVERPMRSALALTADAQDDGHLTVLDVLRRELPTDLAVLSACETGRGRVFRGEGIVGLTRAFMVAGAPRVLCSLWKVDDEATRALMTRFYELWNPKTGEGLGVGAALREAQAHVRSHERWRHPKFWAAWVLWGLP